MELSEELRKELSEQLDQLEKTLSSLECSTGPWEGRPPLEKMIQNDGCEHCMAIVQVMLIRTRLLGMEQEENIRRFKAASGQRLG